ncbi:unnamed protein product [Gordionus sp. m RMFG-2023]|uniref:H/ACA ribonucleoprotein complex subunit 1-like n=1 Tax=Gordionus sp. m RMFG-2023 TaxID=3053472 RepID=UPI0030E4965C
MRGNFSRGRGGGGFGRGRGGFGRGRGGGGGNRENSNYNEIPDRVVECCHYEYPCEEYIICKSTIKRIPYFNAPIFLENKTMIGKVDEIFGPIQDFFFSVKPLEEIKAKSFDTQQIFYIDPNKLLPLERFLPKPTMPKSEFKAQSRGRGRGGFSRGGGSFRGGSGGGRGGRGFQSFRGGRGGKRF